jgi:hypothetical protein
MKQVIVTINACVADDWSLDLDALKCIELPKGMKLIDANADWADDDQPCQ